MRIDNVIANSGVLLTGLVHRAEETQKFFQHFLFRNDITDV